MAKPFSPVYEAGGFLFVSGKIGVDPESGELPAGDVKAQVRFTLQAIAAELKNQGSSMAAVSKTTVFLTDMRNFAEMNEEYVKHFPEPLPARSCIAVSALPRNGALVEIEAIAYTGKDS